MGGYLNQMRWLLESNEVVIGIKRGGYWNQMRWLLEHNEVEVGT